MPPAAEVKKSRRRRLPAKRSGLVRRSPPKSGADSRSIAVAASVKASVAQKPSGGRTGVRLRTRSFSRGGWK
jgi:hypothetical protein